MKHAYGADSEWIGADLIGFSARDITLPGADFSYANLTDASIYESSMMNADFHGATLTNAVFHESYLWDADFTEADIGDTVFSYTQLDDADMTGARGVPIDNTAFYYNTICPDGVNSGFPDGSCDGHWLP